MPAQPGGMAAAAAKAPHAGNTPAALDRRHPARPLRKAPGQHRARIGEKLRRRLRRHVGGGHRTGIALRHAPRGAGVAARHGIHRLEEGRQVKLGATHRARQQHAEHARVEDRILYIRRQALGRVNARRGGIEDGGQGTRARNPVMAGRDGGAGRKVFWIQADSINSISGLQPSAKDAAQPLILDRSRSSSDPRWCGR